MINKVQNQDSTEIVTDTAGNTHVVAALQKSNTGAQSGNSYRVVTGDTLSNSTTADGLEKSAQLFSDDTIVAAAYHHHHGNPPGRGPGNPPGRGPGNPPGRGPGNPPGRSPRYPAPRYPRDPHYRHPPYNPYPGRYVPSPYWYRHPEYYRYHQYYPTWHFTIVFDETYHYYRGPDLSIGSLAGLEREKRSVDYARQDLESDAYRYGRQSPEYREDARAVVQDYAYIISSVFNYGDRHPGDWDLRTGSYQSVVSAIYGDMIRTLDEYERFNPGHRELRNTVIDNLEHSISNSSLAYESGFYEDLAWRIRGQQI